MAWEPLTFSFIFAMFGIFAASIVLQFVATARLAMWLCAHQKKIWRELGRPGFSFFKGEPGNGYFSRTSALNGMFKSMPLQDYQRELSREDEAQRLIRQFRLAGGAAVISFVLMASAGLIAFVRHEREGSQGSGRSGEEMRSLMSSRPEVMSGTL